ncbi:carbonate dehydratase [beta proteobacterium MWH-UniP1]
MSSPSHLTAINDLIEKNKAWARDVSAQDPEFFQKLANQQSPEYLWIGCADSRVPANEIVGLAPGELFVHRNIANLVIHTDLNALSVIQFAIDLLRVKHIIVVGHYGCSGVRVALDKGRVGLADNWIRHIRDVDDKHGAYLGKIINANERHDALCELNVIEQVVNVCQTTSVQDAWDRGQPLTVHGWVYGLKDGLVRDLDVSIANNDDLASRYAAAMTQRSAS